MASPPDDDPAPPSKSGLLARIADTLGIPVDALSDRGDGRTASAAEVSDLVAAFLAVEDPAARMRCLAFVRAAGGKPSGGEGAS